MMMKIPIYFNIVLTIALSSMPMMHCIENRNNVNTLIQRSLVSLTCLTQLVSAANNNEVANSNENGYKVSYADMIFAGAMIFCTTAAYLLDKHAVSQEEKKKKERLRQRILAAQCVARAINKS